MRVPAPAAQRGTILLTLLFLVVLAGLAAGVAGQALKDFLQREREEELLWRGLQYRRALASYARGKGEYPNRLQDLLRDPRSPATVRHIRRLYPEPMSGGDWQLTRDPGNRITGVFSDSDLAPFKQENFPPEIKDFQGKTSYREWVFSPQSGGGAPAPSLVPKMRPPSPVRL